MIEHCNCGHNHNNHGHEHCGHEHNHEHCGPDCHHGDAEAFAESALKKSARNTVIPNSPVRAKAVAERIMTALSEIAGRIAFEDIILGHIKALIDFGERKLSVSITRLDECGQSFDGFDDFEVISYTVTANILSLHNTDAEIDDLMEKLFAE